MKPMKPKKYVIIGQLSPVVFDAPVEHDDLKRAAGNLRNGEMLPGGATSGGYFMLHDGRVVIGSESLRSDLAPGKHDAEILQRFFDEMAVKM